MSPIAAISTLHIKPHFKRLNRLSASVVSQPKGFPKISYNAIRKTKNNMIAMMIKKTFKTITYLRGGIMTIIRLPQVMSMGI
jgi:hypothetical protein